MKTFSTSRQMLQSITTAILPALLLAAVSSASAAPLPPAGTGLGSLDSFSAPTRVAIDPAGAVYVTDSVEGKVSAWDAFGRPLPGKRGLDQPLAVAVDASGRIYVGEEGSGKVTVFDSAWNQVGMLGVGPGEFALPNYIATAPDPAGVLVFVSDSTQHQVKVYQGNARIRTIGAPGSRNGQFRFPAGLLVMPGGELYVVDQGNERVQVFAKSGGFLRSFSLNPPAKTGRTGRAQGIARDAAGRFYVADSFQGYLRVFAPDGTFLSAWGAFGQGPGQFRTPAGLAIDPLNRLFVASLNNHRVEILGLDCFTQTLASPLSQVAPVGATVTFRITADCSSPVSFQWRKGTNNLSNGGIVSGATSAALTLAGVSLADTGDYSVMILTSNGLALTPQASLLVLSPPLITQSPVSRTVNQGGTVTFSVQASGDRLSYQWFYEDSEIGGADSSALTIVNARSSDAGNYRVKVSNAAGFVVSTDVSLSVVVPPEIVEQPDNQTVPEYTSFTLAGIANGTQPMTYQWYRDGTPLSGKTTATLTYSNVTPALNGAYFLRAQNSAGAATSRLAAVTVSPDMISPRLLSATGGVATNRTVTLSFSEPVNPGSAANLSNYTIVGPGGLGPISAILSQATNIILTLNGARTPFANYTVAVKDVTDLAYSPNALAPNPTVLTISAQIDLVSINSSQWKYLQPTNNTLDSQSWKAATFNDTSWSNGFGIFYGNVSNSVTQPAPNPAVKLPFALNASDPANTRVYTVLNVFTNTGNTIKTTTYYFRIPFVFPATTNGATLLLREIVDDGFVLYLNGSELRRNRMASGTPVFSTLASSAGNQTWSPTITSAARILPITGLKTGTNVLAIELHQASTTDTDATLGIWLEAIVPAFIQAAPAIQITRVSPPQKSVNSAAVPDLVVRWNDTGWVLEAAPAVFGPWQTVGTASPVTLPANSLTTTGPQFFRLAMPTKGAQ